MGLPFGCWLIFIGLLWGAEALVPGGQSDSIQFRNPQNRAIGMAGNPLTDDDDILRINQGLIPPEAPESSFLIEGDIIKVSPSRVFSSASPKWPKRRGAVQIPYVISYKYDKQSVKTIKEAFADFAKFTCIKFVPYSYQRDFISIIPMAGCFSSVGRTGGMQVVSLAPACLKRGKGVALHELMHVVGFWHEHSRADRDKYISISWNEILTGFEINFMKSWTSNMLVKYDYSSVLHYGRYAFSMTGLPTITPLSDPYAALGQRWNLSRSDITRVNKLYKCSPTGAGAGSPTGSTTKKNIIDSTSNELEPLPTKAETSPTAKASSLATNTPETFQTSGEPSTQVMSAPTAGTEKLLGRTAMHDEGLSGPLTPVQGVESVKFAPTGLSTLGMTYLEASGKTPTTYVEMSTVEAMGKLLIPVEETSLLGTVSIQEPHFTTVMLSPESQTSPRGVMLHHGKLEGLGTTKISLETLAGIEFPETVPSARVASLVTVGTRAREVGIPKTTDIRGIELAYQSTSLVQTGPSPATEVSVAMTPNQTQPLETQTEVSTEEVTSSSEESSETSMPVVHTAETLALGQTPPMLVSTTKTSHPTSIEKWTTNIPRLTSAKSVTTMAPTSSAPTGWIPSVEMETTTIAYTTEQTSPLPTIQSWTISSTKQGNQSVAHQAYSPGSQEQSTIAIPTTNIKEAEPTEVKQPTLTSFDMAENHTTYLTEIGVQGATRRHNRSTVLSSSGIEMTYIEPPTKATAFMETYTELGFVEATRIKASSRHGFPSLTKETTFTVTKEKDVEYATVAEILPLTGVSQAFEPAEMSMQITANYRNKERMHTSMLFPVGGPSPTASGLMYTTPSLVASQNPQNEGPAETMRSEDRSHVTLPTRSSIEMGVQDRNTFSKRRREHTYTPAYLISPTATELKFMERPTSEASGLETAVVQSSSPSEMRISGVSSAWTEAKAQFSSSTRETALFPVSSPTGKGNSTKVIQSPESAGLPELGTEEYRVSAGIVTLMPPKSRPQTAQVQPMEMPELKVPGKLTPVHTELTTNQVQTSVKNTSSALVSKMSSKATYPSEGSSLLQASPQTFNPIELRLKMSKQQMHAAITSRDNLTPSKGTSSASFSADELQQSAKDASIQTLEIPTLRSEEAKGRGRTFPLGATVEKHYMKLSAVGISESQTTNMPELRTPEALSVHAVGTSFPKVLLSEAMTTPLVGRSERETTHSILTWEPIAQVGPEKQTMAQFPKTNTLSAEHITKGTALEAPAVSRHMESLGIEAKEHGSLLERLSSTLSQAQEITFPPETLTTSSAVRGVWEAAKPPRQRSRWVSHPAHSTKGISLAATEPTYGTAFVGPQHSTVSHSYPGTDKAKGTEAGNQLSLSISSSRTELGTQELKGEPRKEGRPSPTLPSWGQGESLKVEPSLKSQVTLPQASWSKKGLFPFRRTQTFWGMKPTKSPTAMEFPHLPDNRQLPWAQTSTSVPAPPSLKTPGPPTQAPVSSKPNRLESYREKEVANLQGTSVAKTVTEAMHSTRVALLLGVPGNNTLRPREVAMKEETSGYREEGGLATTNLLPSVTLSTETAEQVQFTQVGELIVPENWPSGHPGLGAGKHPTNKTQTEHTSLVSLGELPSLGSEPTMPLFPAEGTSLLQASPHQTFSPSEGQTKSTASQETHATILPWEEYGQSLMSPKGLQPMETSEVAGLFTRTTSVWSPETPAVKLEEVSAFHQKQGQGKTSPLPTGTTSSAENETRMLSSTKITLGVEALEGQVASQSELGLTEVSLAQLPGSCTPAERTSFPGAEATGFVNEVSSSGTGTQITLPNETREQSPRARTPLMGTEATEQSYSTVVVTTMKASKTPSSPSATMLYTATSGHGKKNVEQANTHPPSRSMSSSGSDTTHPSHSLWPPHYQTAPVSTEPLKTHMESGFQSAVGGIPAREIEPTSIGSSLETKTTSSLEEGNEGKSNLPAYGGVTPVGHWGLRHETHAPEWHSRLSEKWAGTVNTTKLTNGDTTWSQGERTAIKSSVGGMSPSDTKEAQGIKAIQLKWAFQRHPSTLFTVDPEILHLVGKRSLPGEVEIPAPPHDRKPDLKVVTPSHRQTGPELRSPLVSSILEKQRADILRGFQKQLLLVPRRQVSPVTALYPAAREFKGVPWWLVSGTSVCAPGRRCGIFRLKEMPFLGRKKATNQAAVVASAKAVRATAPPGMDKPIAASLLRQHSGPGTQGHSIQTPGATVESKIPEWQLCDLEKDLCGWQHSESDDFDWILAGERPARSHASDSISGLQDTPSGGNYISLRSPSTQQTPGQKTALISPVLHGIGCIHFWYSPLGSVMGTINLYIKFADAPEWHKIWTAKGQQGTEWHQVGVEVSQSQKLQVILEGVIGQEAGSDAGIDDLAVCVAECQGGCKELIALYKKQDVQQTK